MKKIITLVAALLVAASVSYASGAKRPKDANAPAKEASAPKKERVESDIETGARVIRETVKDKDKPGGPGREQADAVEKELKSQEGSE